MGVSGLTSAGDTKAATFRFMKTDLIKRPNRLLWHFFPRATTQVEALKTETEVLSARAAAALESEKRADRRREVAETRAQKAEQDLGSRVRELEEQTARLRREVAMGADAAQASTGEGRSKGSFGVGDWGRDESGCEVGSFLRKMTYSPTVRCMLTECWLPCVVSTANRPSYGM